MKHCIDRRTRLRPSVVLPAIALAMAVTLPGCEEQGQITTQTVAKTKYPGDWVTWELPEGWTDIPSIGTRTAVIRTSQEPDALEIAVTRFPAKDMGTLEQNLIRWRFQLGYTTEQDLKTAGVVTQEFLNEATRPVTFFELVGPLPDDGSTRQKSLVAMTMDKSEFWFFKAQDAAPKIDAHRDQFVSLAKSLGPPADPEDMEILRMLSKMQQNQAAVDNESGGDTSSPDKTNDTPTPPTATEMKPFTLPGVSGKMPARWALDTTPRTARVATFIVDVQGQATEIAVSRFPGNVGGLLPNINRWRGQVGLPPLADESEIKKATVAFDQKSADIYDFNGSDGTIHVASIPVGPLTWFFKWSSPVPIPDAEKQRFVAFIKELDFDDE